MLLGDDAPAGEHHGRLGTVIRGEACNRKFVIREARRIDGDLRCRATLDVDDGFERLPEIAVPGRRLQPDLCEARLDPVRCGRKRFGAEASSAARVVGEPCKIGEIAIRRPRHDSRLGIDPTCDVDVRLARRALIAIRAERELAAVRREHRKAVEAFRVRDALELSAVDVDCKQIELPAARVVVIRREDDAPPVREEKRREVGAAEIGHLALLGAISVRNPDLERARAYEAFG